MKRVKNSIPGVVSFNVVIVSDPTGIILDTTLDTASCTMESRSRVTGWMDSSSIISVGDTNFLCNSQEKFNNEL